MSMTSATLKRSVLPFIAAIAGQLIDEKDSESSTWSLALLGYMNAIVGEQDGQSMVDALRKRASPLAAWV